MTFMSMCIYRKSNNKKTDLVQIESGCNETRVIENEKIVVNRPNETSSSVPKRCSNSGSVIIINSNHNNSYNSRPTTIGKLHFPPSISRLRVEKIEGGLMVAGVVVAANCQIILPIFGFLFLLVGCVLTAASYRGPGEDEEPDHYAERIAFTGNSRVLGPACMVVGVIMLTSGSVLCYLTRRARRREQTIGFHCPLHGDFYPLSPVTSSKTLDIIQNNNGKSTLCWPLSKKKKGTSCGGSRRGPGGAIAVGGGAPQCPHSQVASTRSSLTNHTNSPHSQCPTPLPFVVNTIHPAGSGISVAPIIQQSPAEQSYGSIRSLNVGREVASFPLSRTPTPPPLITTAAHPPLSDIDRSENNIITSNDIDDIDIEDDNDEKERFVFERIPVQRGPVDGPVKSVSIILPSTTSPPPPPSHSTAIEDESG